VEPLGAARADVSAGRDLTAPRPGGIDCSEPNRRACDGEEYFGRYACRESGTVEPRRVKPEEWAPEALVQRSIRTD